VRLDIVASLDPLATNELQLDSLAFDFVITVTDREIVPSSGGMGPPDPAAPDLEMPGRATPAAQFFGGLAATGVDAQGMLLAAAIAVGAGAGLIWGRRGRGAR
jgi:hypothetical protein